MMLSSDTHRVSQLIAAVAATAWAVSLGFYGYVLDHW